MRAAQSPELVPEPLPEGRIHDGEQRDPPPPFPQPLTVGVGFGGVPLFPDTPEGQAERLGYYEARRLDDPPYSIFDSNDVRSGRLTALERVHFRRMAR